MLERQKTESFRFGVNTIHPTAKIGDGTKIWHFCNIMKNVSIGSNCSIGSYTEIGPDVWIDHHCRIQAHCFIPFGVMLGPYVFVGPGTVFCNVRKPSAMKKGIPEKTYVQKGAVIGANCTILPGVVIGKGAMVGAGTTVTKNVPEYHTTWDKAEKRLELTRHL